MSNPEHLLYDGVTVEAARQLPVCRQPRSNSSIRIPEIMDLLLDPNGPRLTRGESPRDRNMQYPLEKRTGDVYRKAVALMHLLAGGPSLAS